MYFEGNWPSKSCLLCTLKMHGRFAYVIGWSTVILIPNTTVNHPILYWSYIPCYSGCSSVAVACCFCLHVSIGGHNKSVTWHLASMTDSKAGSHGGTIAPHAIGMDVVVIVLVQYRFEIRTLTGTYAWLYIQTACPWCINSWILLWKGVWGRRFLHFSHTLFHPYSWQ